MLFSATKSCRSTLTGISPQRPRLLSTGLFASREAPVDDIPFLNDLAARVLARRVLRPSAAVMTFPGLGAHIPPTSGLPGPHIGRQSSSTRHAMTASAGRTQDSDRSDGRQARGSVRSNGPITDHPRRQGVGGSHQHHDHGG